MGSYQARVLILMIPTMKSAILLVRMALEVDHARDSAGLLGAQPHILMCRTLTGDEKPR